MKRYKLVNEGTKEVFPLTEDYYVIGREGDIMVSPVHKHVSREHCVLNYEPERGSYSVQNRSKNGTDVFIHEPLGVKKVNLHRDSLASVVLNDGTSFKLGSDPCLFTFNVEN